MFPNEIIYRLYNSSNISVLLLCFCKIATIKDIITIKKSKCTKNAIAGLWREKKWKKLFTKITNPVLFRVYLTDNECETKKRAAKLRGRYMGSLAKFLDERSFLRKSGTWSRCDAESKEIYNFYYRKKRYLENLSGDRAMNKVIEFLHCVKSNLRWGEFFCV